MKTKAQGNSALSFILLIAGIVLLVAALAMDVMGTKFAGRGAMLIFGIIAFFAGLYLIPTMKHHRIYICSNCNYSARTRYRLLFH